MKKVLFLLSILFLGFSLTSCGGKDRSITYVDQNGEEVKVEVSETSDVEQVADVLYAVSQIAQDDVKKMTSTFNTTFKADLKDVSSFLSSVTYPTKIDATASATLALDIDAGLYASGSANLSMTINSQEEKITAKGSALLATNSDDTNIYLDYAVNAAAEGELKDKVKVDFLEIIAAIGQQGSVLVPMPTMTDNYPNVSEITREELVYVLNSFNTTFPHSQIAINSVSGTGFNVNVSFSINDFFAASGLNYEFETDEILKLNVSFTYDGLVNEINIEKITSKNVLATILFIVGQMYSGSLNPEMIDTFSTLVNSFEFELSLKFDYTKAEIPTLTDAEKALYRQEVLS